jgi:hypothetical protein
MRTDGAMTRPRWHPTSAVLAGCYLLVAAGCGEGSGLIAGAIIKVRRPSAATTTHVTGSRWTSRATRARHR